MRRISNAPLIMKADSLIEMNETLPHHDSINIVNDSKQNKKHHKFYFFNTFS